MMINGPKRMDELSETFTEKAMPQRSGHTNVLRPAKRTFTRPKSTNVQKL